MSMVVRDVMAARPVTISQETTIGEAIGLLLRRSLQELYVVNGAGQLLGVVPDFELLKAQLAQVSSSDSVSRLICNHLETTTPDCDVAALAPVFRDSFCRRMPVVENGRLVGQIDRGQVLRAMTSLQTCRQDSELVERRPVMRSAALGSMSSTRVMKLVDEPRGL